MTHALPFTRSVMAAARDQEQQAGVAVRDDVAERVEAAVAGRVGHREVVVVEHRHEAGRAAARGDVAAPVDVGAGDHHERRARA